MRARRREINIFNMSLLDILCGALGAFCFMMIVALPYYIAPGKARDLRKSQEETEKLMHDLEKMKERLPDQKSVEEMEELLKRLEAQVKALQGQVNILTAEKEDLERQVNQLTNEKAELQQQVTQLTNEKAGLQRQVTQLTEEKAQLTQQNQLLQAKNQDLEQENGNLKAQLLQRRPLTLMARADDETQSIDLVTMEKIQVEKYPSPIFNGWLEGQFDVMNELKTALLRARGIAFGVIGQLPPGAESKLYVRLTSPDSVRRTTGVQCAMFGDIRTDPPMKLGKVTLLPERRWALVGTLTIDKNIRPSFKEATEAEREAEWLKLTNSTPTPTPTPTPPPTEAERAAAEAARAGFEANRVKLQEARQKFTKLMRIPFDDTGKNDAEILQLTGELLKDLPPRDGLRREAQFRRDRVLEMKARREGQRQPSFDELLRIPFDGTGKYDADILKLTDAMLKDLPPDNFMRREAQFRRDLVLEMQARRKGQRQPAPSPESGVRPPAPVPSPSP